MRPYEEFLPDFYGMALKDREILPRTDGDAEVFYIVEHSEDEELIKNEARTMLSEIGQICFHFFGRKEPLWHRVFDEEDIFLYSEEREEVALTCGYQDFEDFIDALECRNVFGMLDLTHSYLIYDDRKIYEEVKKALICREKEAPSE